MQRFFCDPYFACKMLLRSSDSQRWELYRNPTTRNIPLCIKPVSDFPWPDFRLLNDHWPHCKATGQVISTVKLAHYLLYEDIIYLPFCHPSEIWNRVYEFYIAYLCTCTAHTSCPLNSSDKLSACMKSPVCRGNTELRPDHKPGRRPQWCYQRKITTVICDFFASDARLTYVLLNC